MQGTATAYGAVVLAGGTATRLDGADKSSIEHAGRTFLEHALAATAAADEVVVVGPEVPTSRQVTFVREDPPLGGPVAGLLAGREAFARMPDVLLVMAVDMPRVTADTVDRLLSAAAGHDGAALCDSGGRRQLVFVVRTPALDRVAPAEPRGRSVRDLLAPLDLADVAAIGDEGRGVDTWQDVRDLGR